jgi:hypothetical protein
LNMEYAIKAAGISVIYRAFNRSEAISALGLLGINEYAAIRMIDVADGLRPADGVERPFTVERS